MLIFFRGVKFISFCHPEVWRLVAQPQNRINSCEAVRVGWGGEGCSWEVSLVSLVLQQQFLIAAHLHPVLIWTEHMVKTNKQGNKTRHLPRYLLSGLLQTVSTEACRGFFLSGSCNILRVLPSTGGDCQHTGEWPIRPWPSTSPRAKQGFSALKHCPVFKGPTVLESKRSTKWEYEVRIF